MVVMCIGPRVIKLRARRAPNITAPNGLYWVEDSEACQMHWTMCCWATCSPCPVPARTLPRPSRTPGCPCLRHVTGATLSATVATVEGDGSFATPEASPDLSFLHHAILSCHSRPWSITRIHGWVDPIALGFSAPFSN